MKLENIVTQTLAKISTALVDHGVVMDSWRSDAIQIILVLAFNRSFQEGRRAGLKEALHLLDPMIKSEYSGKP